MRQRGTISRVLLNPILKAGLVPGYCIYDSSTLSSSTSTGTIRVQQIHTAVNGQPRVFAICGGARFGLEYAPIQWLGGTPGHLVPGMLVQRTCALLAAFVSMAAAQTCLENMHVDSGNACVACDGAFVNAAGDLPAVRRWKHGRGSWKNSRHAEMEALQALGLTRAAAAFSRAVAGCEGAIGAGFCVSSTILNQHPLCCQRRARPHFVTRQPPSTSLSTQQCCRGMGLRVALMNSVAA